MERGQIQTLRFFAILEFSLGLWILSPNPTLRTTIELYLPHTLLGIFFLIGSGLNVFLSYHYNKDRIPRIYVSSYIWLTSMPLMFLGLLFIQNSIKTGTLAATAILAPAIGIYSIIKAAESFPKVVK